MVFATCGPNEVMVVSGLCHGEPLYLSGGGRVFVLPGIHKIDRLSLNTMTLKVETQRVYTTLGVAVSVTGVAQVKIEGERINVLKSACQHFLGKSEKQIRYIALETLEGHQRAIMGNMTVEQLYQDRKTFSKHVFEVASSDLMNMGIIVISYTLKDIHDSEGYLKALGQARTAQVKRDARIGESEAKRDSGIKQALAEESQMKSKYENEQKVAAAERDYHIEKAKFDEQVRTQQAQADMAYDLQAAIQRQKIKEEKMKIIEVERSQQIHVMEQEILRKEKELEAEIRRPAEAERFKKEKLAEASAIEIQLKAEAQAQSIKLKGEAEAAAIRARAKAEAEQMTQKAEAWKQYQDAALVDMVLETLPRVVAEVATPLSNVNNIKLVSTGGSEVGASKLTGEVLSIVECLPKMINTMTGVDIAKATGGRSNRM